MWEAPVAVTPRCVAAMITEIPALVHAGERGPVATSGPGETVAFRRMIEGSTTVSRATTCYAGWAMRFTGQPLS